MNKDQRRLRKEVLKANLSTWQRKAAFVLLAVNGIDCAIEYVAGLREQKSTTHG